MTEIETLKNEVKASESAIDADKFMFQRKLMGEMGKQIRNELENPTKPNIWTGLKYRILRWKTIKDGKKKERDFKKQNKKEDF